MRVKGDKIHQEFMKCRLISADLIAKRIVGGFRGYPLDVPCDYAQHWFADNNKGE